MDWFSKAFGLAVGAMMVVAITFGLFLLAFSL